MTSEHYRQAEELTDRTDVIGALPLEQLAEAHVHATRRRGPGEGGVWAGRRYGSPTSEARVMGPLRFCKALTPGHRRVATALAGGYSD
jgi:hypothetical protein